MKILFDICHPHQFNLFKNTLLKLEKNIFNVTCMRRSPLVEVIKHDCPSISLTVIGDYKYNKGIFSMIFRVVLPRLILLWKLIKRGKYNIVITCNSYQANIIAKILEIPSMSFNDDTERKTFKLIKIFSDEVLIPLIFLPKGKIKTFNALMEWAYLSPTYFTPQIKELERYNIEKKRYFFIREVSNKSFNYKKQASNIVLKFANQLSKNYKVLLSLEDKSKKELYPKDWIILQEPLNDIYSLIYFSKLAISSGDSMARESAMLGVPSIYCGVRDMRANKIMIEKGMLFKINPNELPNFVAKIVSGEMRFEDQALFRRRLLSEWDDVTEFIIKQIKKYEKK